MKDVKIRHLKFVSEEMIGEAKAPKNKDYCLMDDPDIFPLYMLKEIKKRIDHGVKIRTLKEKKGQK